MISDFKGKWVLITGAGSGIGLETARAFASVGARLVLTDVHRPSLSSLFHELSSSRVDCIAKAFDVASEESVEVAAEELHREIGPIDVLVNNAGIGYLGSFLDTPTSAWRRQFDVNVMGVVHMTKAFLPSMLEAGGPKHLVNVASAAGISPAPNLSGYGASKHALVGLHDALKMELHNSDVKMSLVCPGVIDTPIVRNLQAVAKEVPVGQLQKIDAYYRKHGAKPSLVAGRIVRAVQTDEDLVLVGPTAKQLYFAKRLSRSLAHHATIHGCKRNGYLW